MTARSINVAPMGTWCAAALFFAGVMQVTWSGSTNRPSFAFELSARSPEPQVMQLYFQSDPAEELSEEKSISQRLQSAVLQTCRFPLPDGDYRRLRFDPSRHGGTIRVADARIVEIRSGREVCALPVSTWRIGSNVHGVVLMNDQLVIDVAADQTDPTLDIPLPASPLALHRNFHREIRLTVLWFAVSVATAVGINRFIATGLFTRLFGSFCVRPLSAAERWVSQAIPHDILPVDSCAIGFLIAVFTVAAGAAACGIHGSSSSIRSTSGIPVGDWKPLLGTPKEIRADEWNIHTPLILNQLNRADRFAVESNVGPQNTSLIANVPVRHWSTLFRPQFFPFFFMSAGHAFAAYWQIKHFLLITGTFLLFLLLARSSAHAAFGSIWFWLSSYTQWAFSWPALLPEMIGLACISIVAACLVFVVNSRWVAGMAGAVFVLTTVDFALCAYPPFQIPLIWAAIGICSAWMIQHRRLHPGPARDTTIRADRSLKWIQGLVTLGISGGVIVVVMICFGREIWPLVTTTAHTIYPGNRSVPGGGVAWQQLVANFVDPLKDEAHCPPLFHNICEGSGYFWFAPITLVLGGIGPTAKPAGARRALYAVLFVPFAFLACWMLLPVPASVGLFFILNKVQSSRVIPALGLLNIAITLVFVADLRQRTQIAIGRKTLLRLSLLVCVFALGFFALLMAANQGIGHFFATPQLAAAALIASVASVALAGRRPGLFAALVLVPLAWSNFLINPIDRGFDVYDQSALRKFVDTHACKDARWLILSDNATAPSYFEAIGLDVLNALNYVPFIDRWRVFDLDGSHSRFYNGSGIALARALPTGSPARFEAIPEARLGPPIVWRFSVDPADPRLREVGVRYFAFEGPHDEARFPAARFDKLTDAPVDGFCLYRSKDP